MFFLRLTFFAQIMFVSSVPAVQQLEFSHVLRRQTFLLQDTCAPVHELIIHYFLLWLQREGEGGSCPRS